MDTPTKPVGLTKDSGWQFGLRKTFPYTQDYLWDFLFSDRGLRIWLGELKDALVLKQPFETKAGITGLVRVLAPYSHIRMNWKKKGWANTSTVQVRVMGNPDRATVSFHQEKLADEAQREEMKTYWNEKMAAIEKALGEK